MAAEKPKISINKLAEYMVSKARRQRKLLRDRKYPDPDFQMGMFHREASEAVASYLVGGGVSTENLEARIQVLNQQSPDKLGTQRRLNANVEALERFLDMLDDFDLTGMDLAHGEHSPQKLTFHTVEVSVRPEIIVRGEVKGKKLVGAIKLHFSKGFEMGEDAAGYVSAASQEFCRRFIAANDETVYSPYCQVFDIGSGTVWPGVKSTKARLTDIEDTCANIKDIWPNL